MVSFLSKSTAFASYIFCLLLILGVFTFTICNIDLDSSKEISSVNGQRHEQPNILLLVSEDNSPETVGVYGDPVARTPNIDRLAEEGIVFRNAFANSPVCAIARSTLISGMHAPSIGLHLMRSRIPVPERIENQFYPRLLQEAGYYTTNNGKTDYNVPGPHDRFWDESGSDAHYKNRKPDQPFFAVFNTGKSHESSMFLDVMSEEPETNPEDIQLPDYQPDIPEVRRSWAHYYDFVSDVDSWIGSKLEELEERGLKKDTIVLYFSDHGGVLPRSKRFLYDTGTAVPMVIRVPEKWQHLVDEEPGSTVERFVSFIDLPPTFMSLAGAEIPDEYQGRVFLGKQKQSPEHSVFLYRGRQADRIDIQRGVFDGRYRYIRNYMPHRPNGQYINYPFRMQSMQAWYQAWQDGQTTPEQSRYWLPQEPEELYDTANDPWEVNNLADNPAYADKLAELRKEMRSHMTEYRDAGFLPEDMFDDLSNNGTLCEYIQSDQYPFERLMDVAELATIRNPADLTELKDAMQSNYAPTRFWGAMGAVVLGYDAKSAQPILKELSNDKYISVQATAAEALARMGEMDIAMDIFEKQLSSVYNSELLYTVNALANIDVPEQYHEQLVEKLRPLAEDENRAVCGDQFEYSRRTATYLVKKWTEEEYPPQF